MRRLFAGAAGLMALVASVSLALPGRAQDISFGEDRAAAAKKGHVELLSDAVGVESGKPQFVELRFRVDPGYHINSHTPKDELLIPTVLKVEPMAGVKVDATEYPRGEAFKLTVGDGELLDVYQGEFRVRLRVVAAKGVTELKGALHYQACDHSACFPPRSLDLKVVVTGR